MAQYTNIEPIHCKISASEKELIEKMAEYQINFYKRIFEFTPATINIKLIGNRKEYLALAPDKSLYFKTAGFYAPVSKNALVDQSRSTYLKTIYHEMQHALMDQVLGRSPAWLNEGMSELFEYFEVNKNEVKPNIEGYKFYKMRQYIADNSLDLKEFLNLSHRQWLERNGSGEGYSYTVSYSFVCFLFMKYPNSVEKILKKLEQGNSSIEAIEYATKKKFSQIESEFKTEMG